MRTAEELRRRTHHQRRHGTTCWLDLRGLQVDASTVAVTGSLIRGLPLVSHTAGRDTRPIAAMRDRSRPLKGLELTPAIGALGAGLSSRSSGPVRAKLRTADLHSTARSLRHVWADSGPLLRDVPLAIGAPGSTVSGEPHCFGVLPSDRREARPLHARADRERRVVLIVSCDASPSVRESPARLRGARSHLGAAIRGGYGHDAHRRRTCSDVGRSRAGS